MSSGLEHTRWLPLLGLPLTVHTNSGALSELLDRDRSLGMWAELPAELIAPAPTIQIDVLLGAPEAQVGGLGLYRRGELDLLGDGPRLLLADRARGYGLACMPAEPLADAAAAIWELGARLAHGRGRTPFAGAALERRGQAVLLAGADLGPLLEACIARGMRPLARRVAHLSDGPRGPLVWGDGAGGDLLCCAGPPALCVIARGTARASQIAPLEGEPPPFPARAAYRLGVGADLATAAALIEHVAA